MKIVGLRMMKIKLLWSHSDGQVAEGLGKGLLKQNWRIQKTAKGQKSQPYNVIILKDQT